MTITAAVFLSTWTTAPPSEAASVQPSSVSKTCPQKFHQAKHARYARQVFRREQISKQAKKRLVTMRVCQHSDRARVNARRLARRHRKARKRRLARPKLAGLPSCTWAPESGGDYNAVNPSSGAFGKYQVIPSTWKAHCSDLDRGRAGQEKCARRIWNAQGPGAWVNC